MRALMMTLAGAALLTQGCVTQSETMYSTAMTGAMVGALGGAALSEKGDNRRSDGALRGALGGAALGLLYGGYQDAQQQAAQAEQVTRYSQVPGQTRCTAVKEVNRYGEVITTERCNSSVTRSGYKNY